MSRRSLIGIEFETEIPDDCVWDDDGEKVVRPGGMALCEALVVLLEQSGIPASIPHMDLEHDSWDFAVEWRGERFRIQVVHMDFCLIAVDGGPWLLARLLFRRAPRRKDLIEHIQTILTDDPRFSEIRPHYVTYGLL